MGDWNWAVCIKQGTGTMFPGSKTRPVKTPPDTVGVLVGQKSLYTKMEIVTKYVVCGYGVWNRALPMWEQSPNLPDLRLLL